MQWIWQLKQRSGEADIPGAGSTFEALKFLFFMSVQHTFCFLNGQLP